MSFSFSETEENIDVTVGKEGILTTKIQAERIIWKIPLCSGVFDTVPYGYGITPVRKDRMIVIPHANEV